MHPHIQFSSVQNSVDDFEEKKVGIAAIYKLWHRYPAEPHKLIRLIVTLQDYEPGQLMQYGNYIYTGWRAGEIHCFDTLNVPHGTVNMSKFPRTIFVITAVRTDETDEIFRNSNKDTIHTL